MLFWVLWYTKGFSIRPHWLSITYLQLALPSRLPINCQRICWDWRKSPELFSENRELFADRFATFLFFEMPAFFSFFWGGWVRILSFVIFYSHYFPLLILTYSALRMWPEVALLVTGCSNEITKSSFVLWLTGVLCECWCCYRQNIYLSWLWSLM